MSEEEIEEKYSALDELFSGSQNYKKGKDYKELIDFISSFPELSPFNAFLIRTQNKGVEIVRTASQWRKLNRKVKPYSRPLVILRPFGPVSFVYDIADTEGEEIPEFIKSPFATTGELDPNIYYNTKQSTAKCDIPVEESQLVNAAAGYARRINNNFKINLNSNWDINVKYSTLIHELAHIFCGHLGIHANSWWQDRKYLEPDRMEIEAESIAYLVSKRNGIVPPSMKYLSEYISNDVELPNISLDTIINVSGYIEKMNDKYFAPKKPLKNKK